MGSSDFADFVLVALGIVLRLLLLPLQLYRSTDFEVHRRAKFPWHPWHWMENYRKDLKIIIIWLVVWNINFILPEILGIIIPIDVHIFQRG